MTQKSKSFTRASFLRMAVGAGMGGVLSPLVSAQTTSFPNRPIRILVGVTAGGGADSAARLVAERLQAALGQPVLVENRPGASSAIAAQLVANSAPDGHTLFLMAGTLAIANAVNKSLPVNVLNGFEPIALLVESPFLLVVNANHPAKTASEFIAMARAKPGAITYGSSGAGTYDYMAGEIFSSKANIKLTNVPYKGTADAVMAMIGGQVDACFGSNTPLVPHVKAGRVRALGVVGNARIRELPELPSLVEAAQLPPFEFAGWIGLAAPAGTPKSTVETLNRELQRIMREPAFLEEKILPMGFVPIPSSSERMRTVLKADVERFKEIALANNLVAQ